ncbi:MAG: hypothetical protein ACYC6M_16640 [Terriglobales bacterium]
MPSVYRAKRATNHTTRLMISDGALLVASAVVLLGLLARRVARSDKFTLSNAVYVRSRVDGMPYKVHPQHTDPQGAADILASTNARLVKLMKRLKDKYRSPAWRAQYPARATAMKKLLERYSPDNLVENSPLDPEGDTAYVRDKGLVMALCLRERDPALKKCLRGGCTGVNPKTMRLHRPDTTFFVAVHELAHIAIDDVDHPPRFWSAFKFLLTEAHEGGKESLLANDDFARAPITYCGLAVDYNPYYDPRVATL